MRPAPRLRTSPVCVADSNSDKPMNCRIESWVEDELIKHALLHKSEYCQNPVGACPYYPWFEMFARGVMVDLSQERKKRSKNPNIPT